jgi:putative flippase GtrA
MYKGSAWRRDAWRFVKFALFSISAGGIETGVFYLLGLVPGFGYWACYLPALVASVVWNFTLNRRFTFQSAVNVPRAMFKVFCYYAVFTPLSTILGDYLTRAVYPGDALIYNLVFFSTLLVNFITEFLYQRFYVFRGEIDNREAEEKGDA